MNRLNQTKKWALCLFGTLALTFPVTVGAADNEAWNQGQAQLEQNLQPGQPADTYRKKIEEMGYKVTSTNYNNEDYLEYEIVKGDQTWEVQIDVDENTKKATNVDIAMNMWRAEATDQVIEQASASATGRDTGEERTAMTRGNRYSDRDRTAVDRMVNELEALPVGRDKQFYKEELKKMGYTIAKVNKDDQDELDLETVKNGQSLALNVEFDEGSGKSTEVDANTLWAESEATSQVRESQERPMEPTSKPGTSGRSSGASPAGEMGRRSQADR